MGGGGVKPGASADAGSLGTFIRVNRITVGCAEGSHTEMGKNTSKCILIQNTPQINVLIQNTAARKCNKIQYMYFVFKI